MQSVVPARCRNLPQPLRNTCFTLTGENALKPYDGNDGCPPGRRDATDVRCAPTEPLPTCPGALPPDTREPLAPHGPRRLQDSRRGPSPAWNGPRGTGQRCQIRHPEPCRVQVTFRFLSGQSPIIGASRSSDEASQSRISNPLPGAQQHMSASVTTTDDQPAPPPPRVLGFFEPVIDPSQHPSSPLTWARGCRR